MKHARVLQRIVIRSSIPVKSAILRFNMMRDVAYDRSPRSDGEELYYPEFWKTECGNMDLILGPYTNYTDMDVMVELTNWSFWDTTRLELTCRECTGPENLQRVQRLHQFVHVFCQSGEEVPQFMRDAWPRLPMLGWWKPNNIVCYEGGIVSLMLW